MAVFTHTVNVETDRAQASLRDLEGQTERNVIAFRQAEGAAERFGDSAGRVGTNAAKLGGILDRVAPGLGELARLTNDGADAFEVAAESGGAFARVGVRIGAIVPPIAAAVAVLAGAYFTLSSRVEAANEAMLTAAERADAAADANARVREQALLAALATDKITQEEFNRLAAIRTASELFADQVQQQRQRLQGAREEIRSLQEQREEVEALVKSLRDAKQRREEVSLAGQGGILAGTELVTTSERLQQAERRLAGLNDQLQQQANIAGAAAQSLGVLDAATERYAADIETVSNATSTTREAVEATTGSVTSLAEALDRVDLTTLGRVSGAEGAIQIAGPVEVGLDTEEIAARRQRRLGAVSAGLDAIANPAAALGALGPAGGILQGLSAIGGLGSEGVERQLDELLNGIVGGVEALPEILVEVIPAFISALLTELPRVLLELIPNLVRALIEGWQNRRDDGVPGGTAAYSDNPDVQRELENREAASSAAARDPFGASTARTSRAATTGRIARAQGAARLSIARSATARGAGGGAAVNIQVNQLGPADATQDSYLRTLGRLQDQTTGLRG